ncbi:MAG: pyridoxal-5'-phosphate-dependent protein subunit beta [Chloroflexi bacterium RBG_16_69_14]|nr:MAG: pyridoxal-5'-phosphate-dependent protein subunit beta [Chloroflexi bacterium RBG_16_69_14]
MQRPGLERDVVDQGVYDRTVRRFSEAGIVMPTFAQLADPATIDPAAAAALASVDPDAADPANLQRVHWYNGPDRRTRVPLPAHIVLPTSLTGVDARIVVALGDRFPMIASHKVLAAYACLAPRIVTGQFDPSTHRAVWPSTGNYCRGGVAISRIMGCRGVAVLPEGMSQERFDWLARWVTDPADIIRTPGSESNVKEIYDRCAELDRDPLNVIFNQFSEFGNYLVHYLATGRALGRIVESMQEREPDLRLHAFVSATGSAGTIGAGDFLKERHEARIVAVEALECPTMLENGFGEHNIQGIGDKHIPLIHNVMNTDTVVGISDRATDQLNVLFNTTVGREYLTHRRGVPLEIVDALDSFGLSSICNVLAAIAVARHERLGPDDVIVTVATDGAAMYLTERDKVLARDFANRFDRVDVAEVFARHVLGDGEGERLLDLTPADRRRIFNLGYFTWVEQQAVPFDTFVERREPDFWRELRTILPVWDGLIEEFNERTRTRVPA